MTIETSSMILKSKKLNLGCGNVIMDGWINCDKYNPKADVKADALDLPFDDESFDEVLFNHVLEHIPWRKHTTILEEIHRVMAYDGKLAIGYPEWDECAKAFLENKHGDRWSWWVQTLYGTQENEGQFHVAPVTYEHLKDQLIQVGFKDITHKLDQYNALVECVKTYSMDWHTQII